MLPRILRIHNRLVIGGPTPGILNLTKQLSSNFETLLLAGEKEDHEEDATDIARGMGIEPIIIPEMGRSLNFKKDLFALNKLRAIIKKFKPDIIHTHAAKPGTLGRLAGILNEVPVLVHTYEGHVFHSYFGKTKTRFFLEIERALAKKTDALIAISPAQKHELSNIFKVAASYKFETIPLGFDFMAFTKNQFEKRRRFRQEFDLKEDCIALGIVGRLVPIKNHELFIEGIKFLKDNRIGNVKGFIIGDGESKEALMRYVNARGLSYSEAKNSSADIIFTSWRKDVDIITNGLDIACLTSFNEGTPVSIMEAQAAGKPVVCTNVGGIADITIDGETALLSDVSDSKKYFSNLKKVVEDIFLRSSLGEKGRIFSSKRFGVNQFIQQHKDLYLRLLSQ